MQLLKTETEKTSSILINGPFYEVYAQAVTLAAGDIIQVKAQSEVTNNYSYNIGVGRYLLISTDPTALDGTRIAPAVMENCTPSEHHSVIISGGDWQTPVDGVFYVKLIAYAVANSAQSGHTLRVEQGYGFLSIVRHNP